MTNFKNPFAWAEIYVEDMGRAQKFYQTVLNIEMQHMPKPEGVGNEEDCDENYEMLFFPGVMDAPGISGALVKSSMAGLGTGGTLIYFECDDCALEISRVEAAGGKVLNQKMSIGQYGFCGICADTEGNPIGFHSMK
ncbi:VOC family protein [Pedobacter antarcticus]|uniref:VOC family protein n=1 Tax=Pedobacter antarcticus TaxID=34086 RepID=UPI00292F5CED|nr:VOC family protein [Pedobacter antarcticus]